MQFNSSFSRAVDDLARSVDAGRLYGQADTDMVKSVMTHLQSDQKYVWKHDLKSLLASLVITMNLQENQGRAFTHDDAVLFRKLAVEYEKFVGAGDELQTRNTTVKVYAQVFDHESGAMQILEFDAADFDLDINDHSNQDTLTIRGHLARHERYEERPL